MFTSCGPVNGAGPVSISTLSSPPPPDRPPLLAGVRRVSEVEQRGAGGALPRLSGRGGHAGACAAPLGTNVLGGTLSTWVLSHR